MDPIKVAIKLIESRDLGEDFSYRKVAKIYGVNQVTLSQKHRGVTGSNVAARTNRIKLSL
jgi:hypothetical protein